MGSKAQFANNKCLHSIFKNEKCEHESFEKRKKPKTIRQQNDFTFGIFNAWWQIRYGWKIGPGSIVSSAYSHRQYITFEWIPHHILASNHLIEFSLHEFLSKKKKIYVALIQSDVRYMWRGRNRQHAQ